MSVGNISRSGFFLRTYACVARTLCSLSPHFLEKISLEFRRRRCVCVFFSRVILEVRATYPLTYIYVPPCTAAYTIRARSITWEHRNRGQICFVKIREYNVFCVHDSIAITMVHRSINQDQIRLVKMLEYVGFCL